MTILHPMTFETFVWNHSSFFWTLAFWGGKFYNKLEKPNHYDIMIEWFPPL